MASSRTLSALILAAGQGKRMYSAYPKVLHEVCGVPLVMHIIRMLESLKVSKKVVVVGHMRELVMKTLKSANVEFAVQAEQRGTAHAVQMATKQFKNVRGDVLVLAGDVPLVSKEVILKLCRAHTKARAAATVLTTELVNPRGYGRIVRNAEGSIRRIVEELDASPEEKAIREVNSGIYIFDAQLLFRKIRSIKRNAKKNEFYLTDIIELFIREGIATHAYCDGDTNILRGVNSRTDLAALNTVMNRQHLDRLMARGVTILSPDTTFIGGDVTVGQDTIIYPCTFIESGVTIGKDCEIGPFCKIRKGTRVDSGSVIGSFVEVNRSHVKASTNIKHLAYIGDATVGPRANIGAGTITANYDGKNKHKTVIGEGVHIGSNTVLVAPVTVGKFARTGAGAVVRPGHNVPAHATAVGVPARVVTTSKK